MLEEIDHAIKSLPVPLFHSVAAKQPPPLNIQQVLSGEGDGRGGCVWGVGGGGVVC